jgi:hypothetical protein
MATRKENECRIGGISIRQFTRTEESLSRWFWFSCVAKSRLLIAWYEHRRGSGLKWALSGG